MKCHGALFQISVTPVLTEQYLKPLSFQKRTFSDTSVVSALDIEENARDAKLMELGLITERYMVLSERVRENYRLEALELLEQAARNSRTEKEASGSGV